MAELKRTFTGGKMDKDTDERIVQNGLYREALNISVATSEDSDVGAAQNILGNTKVSEAIQHSVLRDDICKEGNPDGAFINENCIGYRIWEGEYTDIPAMGNSGSIINYLNVGDVPVFKLYDNINNNQFLLEFDGNCYSNANHTDIINCGFVNNGIYYINSLTVVY